ncbi:MAG: DoxX family protein [Agriterribacter sp.]
MRVQQIMLWILRIIAAGILLQALRFKFTADAETVYIFSKLGMEPWGRIGAGIVELIAAVLILIPRTTAWGALAALIVMTGAIFFHLTTLDVSIMGDSGLLFYMAIIVWICCAILFMVYRAQVLIKLHKLIG